MKKLTSLWVLMSTILLFVLFTSDTISAQEAFTDVTVECGITSPSDANAPLEHDGFNVIDVIAIGTGAAFLDYNNDGFLDIYLTMRTGRNYMYRNDGPTSNYSFTDVTAALGLEDTGGDGSGVAVADYNNDGFSDIYLCNGDEDILFMNVDGTSFVDVTESSGISLTDDSRTTSASWGDYDNDGLLDLYLCNYYPVPNSNNTVPKDILYHNEGNGKFVDVSDLFDLGDLIGYGFIGGFSDFDNDGDLDIFVINDCAFGTEIVRTRVFENEGGTDPLTDWTFTQVAADIGIDFCSNPMGLAVGDIDHNGFQDYAVSDIGPINLWTNEDGILTDISSSAGVNNQPSGYYSWGINFTDYNLDGWLDLFIAEGSIQYLSTSDPQHNYFYENNGGNGLTFTDKSAVLNMDDVEVARTSIFGDFDNDGDPDFLILNYSEEVQMKKNNNATGYNWLKVDLEGVTSNRDGIGSKIKLTSGSMVQYFETRSGSSLGGGDDIVAYFGIANNPMIDEIEITWPSGIIQTVIDILPNQKIIIQEESTASVEFSNFTAVLDRDVVELKWSTISEIDNKGFQIQRSNDGITFNNIGWVDGAGMSSAYLEYGFDDDHPDTDDNYYRIMQVDHDGSQKYSTIRKVIIEGKKAIKLFPNPLIEGNLFVEAKDNNKIDGIDIFDLQNKRIRRIVEPNESKVELKLDDLSRGIYFIRIESEGSVTVKKLVVQ